MNCQRKSTDRFAAGELYFQVVKRPLVLAIKCVGKYGFILVVSRLDADLSKKTFSSLSKRQQSSPVFTVIVVDNGPAERIDKFGQSHFVIALEINALEQFCDNMRNRIVRIIIGRNVLRQRHVEMAVNGLRFERLRHPTIEFSQIAF
jgi:hypothetical protein